MLKSVVVAALAICVLSGVSAAEPLNSQDIRKLAPGRYAVNVMGIVNITVSMKPNGVIIGSSNGEKDRGVWSVRGNKLCVAWNNWYDGKQRCANLSGKNGSYAGGGLSMRRI